MLKLIYDNQDDIPEALREYYVERGGKWHLQAEGLKTQADVDAVKKVADKERAARADLEKKLKRFEALGDRDPDELLKLADEVEDLRAQLEAGGGDKGGKDEEIQRRIDAAVAKATNPLKRELDRAKADLDKERAKVTEKDQQVEGLVGRMKRAHLEQQLTAAATAAKVRGEALPDILRYQDVFEVETDDAGNFTGVRTRDNVGVTPGLAPDQWLADQQQSRPHWWPTSVGGGATGGTGGKGARNPFAKDSANLTEAGALLESDRAKAETLARAAGYNSPEAAIDAMAAAGARKRRPGAIA